MKVTLYYSYMIKLPGGGFFVLGWGVRGAWGNTVAGGIETSSPATNFKITINKKRNNKKKLIYRAKQNNSHK